MFVDRVLFSNRPHDVAAVMCDMMVNGSGTIYPDRDQCEYDENGSPILCKYYLMKSRNGSWWFDCEDIRWALSRGYIRSQFYGPTCVERSSKLSGEAGEDVEVVKWDKPAIKYVVTQKGMNTRVWF